MYAYAFINRFVFAFPIKTLFFLEVTGSFMLAMSIFAVQEWSGVLFEIPTGCLSDRWGRRKVAIIGAAARLACFALYAFAPGYAMLFAGAVCYGLSEALASGNNEAILYDSLKEHNQEHLYHSVFARFSGLKFGYFSCRRTYLQQFRHVCFNGGGSPPRCRSDPVDRLPSR